MTTIDLDGHDRDPMRNLRDDARRAWDRLPFLLPSLIAIGLGLVLLMPTSTFDLSPAWRSMRSIVDSELFWGFIFVGVGGAKLVGATLNLPYRRHAGYALFGLYLFTAASFVLSVGIATTGSVTYAGLAALSLWGPKHAEHAWR